MERHPRSIILVLHDPFPHKIFQRHVNPVRRQNSESVSNVWQGMEFLSIILDYGRAVIDTSMLSPPHAIRPNVERCARSLDERGRFSRRERTVSSAQSVSHPSFNQPTNQSINRSWACRRDSILHFPPPSFVAHSAAPPSAQRLSPLTIPHFPSIRDNKTSPRAL